MRRTFAIFHIVNMNIFVVVIIILNNSKCQRITVKYTVLCAFLSTGGGKVEGLSSNLKLYEANKNIAMAK